MALSADKNQILPFEPGGHGNALFVLARTEKNLSNPGNILISDTS